MTDHELSHRMREADQEHHREHFATILRTCGKDADTRRTVIQDTEPTHTEPNT